MPLGTNHVVKAAVDTSGFVPEIWSDEIQAVYKQSLVAANLFKKMNFSGKKGDTVRFPRPTRGEASLKNAQQQVTLIAEAGDQIIIPIDRHFEYSRLIEDIAEVQANATLRRYYTDDAAYALARRMDTDLLALGREAQSSGGVAYANAFVGTGGATAYDGSNESNIDDAGIRRSIQRLDEADVPMEGRSLIIPPSQRNVIMGIDRFTQEAFVGDAGSANTIRNGQIGDLYGVKVFVTTNTDRAEISSSPDARIALMFHPDFGVMLEQVGVRVQTQYKQEYLGDLMTADCLYGVGVLRPEAAVAIATPAA